MAVFDQDLIQSLEALRDGGTILYPTDTIWGIGCDATSSTAVKKVFDIKQRPSEKSMIVLLSDERELKKYVANPDPMIGDFLSRQLRPTTIIFDGAIGLAGELIGADGTIAIRIVKDDFCRHLLRRFRKPIVSTSANLSGDPSPSSFSSISPAISAQVDYIVNYRKEENTPALPSMIVRWNHSGPPTIIRE